MKRKAELKRIITLNFILICFLTYVRKTFKDSIFVKGDIIIVPELIFDLSYAMKLETYDFKPLQVLRINDKSALAGVFSPASR